MDDVISIEIDKNTGELLGYWSVKEFADLNNVTILTVKRWIYNNQIDAIKVGNMRFIPFNTCRPGFSPRELKKRSDI